MCIRDRDIEKAFIAHSEKCFQEKTEPSLNMATNIGNMYTASLYGGLAAYLCSKTRDDLIGNRVALFSYGSGLISSFFSLKIRGENLDLITSTLGDLNKRLESRIKVEPSEFSQTLKLREESHGIAPYHPSGSINRLAPGTWYLKEMDELKRRNYAKVEILTNGHI